ncbi:hypothetical protein EV363DRAFT_1583696 [Boletus edulis]|nr:hypothetical protein EV363DRAFT_1583696 [Boletus edulis]
MYSPSPHRISLPHPPQTHTRPTSVLHLFVPPKSSAESWATSPAFSTTTLHPQTMNLPVANANPLEDAISTLRDAVVLTPHGHPHKPSGLNNLGLSFRARFHRLGELSDLEDAISTHRDPPILVHLASLSSSSMPPQHRRIQHAETLLLYSGEHRPRVPVDNTLHVLELQSTPPSLRSVHVRRTRRFPRHISVSAVHDPHTNNLYIWGGRGGADMTPFFQAGIWKASLDALDTPSTTTLAWECLPAVNDDSDAAPGSRSYHASAVSHIPRSISGLSANTCRADSPLCMPTTSGASSQTHPPNLAVVLPSPQVTQGTPPLLDIYTPSTDTWPTLYPAPDGFPAARSVHGLVPFMTSTVANRERIPIALLHHGEKDTSSVGHAGAGVFWANAWLLVVTSTSKSTPSLEWKKLRVEGTT